MVMVLVVVVIMMVIMVMVIVIMVMIALYAGVGHQPKFTAMIHLLDAGGCPA